MKDDQRFVHNVADTPFEFTGMRLGRFDAPLVHNRKLIKQIYFGDHDALTKAASLETWVSPLAW